MSPYYARSSCKFSKNRVVGFDSVAEVSEL